MVSRYGNTGTREQHTREVLMEGSIITVEEATFVVEMFRETVTSVHCGFHPFPPEVVDAVYCSTGIDSVSGPSPTTKARNRWQGVDNPRTGGNGKGWVSRGRGNRTRRIPIISAFCGNPSARGWGLAREWAGVTSKARQATKFQLLPGSSAVINSPRTAPARPGRLVPSILKTVTREADIKTPSECSPLLAEFRETRGSGWGILIDGTRPFLSIPNPRSRRSPRRNRGEVFRLGGGIH